MRNNLSFISLIVLLFGVTPCYASLLLGTKNLDYSFPINHNSNGRVYINADIAGNPLEEGFQYYQDYGDNKYFALKYSVLQKDNLLEGSKLAKLSWRATHALKAGKYEAKLAVGYFNFPSMYSAWTSFEAAPAETISIYSSHILANNLNGINWHLGLRGALSSDIYTGNPSYDMLAFTHFDGLWGADYKKNLPFGLAGKLTYSGLIRTSAYLPLDYFQNQELGVGLENSLLSVKYFQPFKHEYKRENYPFQGRRTELNFHSPIPLAMDFKFNLISPFEGNNIYMASAAKDFKAWAAALFLSQNYSEKSLGFQISYNEDLIKALSDYYLSKERQPTADNVRTEHSYVYSYFTPEEVDVANIDQLAKVLTTPADANRYTTYFIDYTNEHNTLFGGLTNLYSPQEVFSLKKGNCTEQASLQKYILDKHGYETAILCTLGRGLFHSILAYKDPASGKWNALDNSGSANMYIAESDNYEGLITKVFPGWMSIVVKGDGGKGIYEVDSSTKWYIEDWFEKE